MLKNTAMDMSDEAKKAFIEYFSEQDKLDKGLNDIINKRVGEYLNNPQRELSENEKKLLKNSAKQYNIMTLILTIISAISIVAITTLYTSLIQSKSEESLISSANEMNIKLIEMERKYNEFTFGISDETQKSKDEIEKFVLENKGQINKVVDEFEIERSYLAITRGEFIATNRDFIQKNNDVTELMKELNSLIAVTVKTEKQLKEITEKINANDRLLRILENPSQQLYINKVDNYNYMVLGELFIQWGGGHTTRSDGKTTINFAFPVSHVDDISISVIPERHNNKSFPEITEITNNSVIFTLYNAKTNRNYAQLDSPFRYLLVGKLEDGKTFINKEDRLDFR